MNYTLIQEIKRIAIIAIASDDELLEMLVLKGGNAIEMIHQVNNRASLDLDFSMEDGLDEEEQKRIAKRLKKTFLNTFEEYNYEVFDTKFTKKPKQELDKEKQKFWGGYKFEFKVIKKQAEENRPLEKKRREAIVVGKKNSTKFMIEISPFEYCSSKVKAEFEDYSIYVYSPDMIVLEKIRAICQQIVGSSYRKPRGRDFFDIYYLCQEFKIDLFSKENKFLLQAIFEAKKVPIDFIYQIKNDAEFHRENFETSLKDTINPNTQLEDFDFYVKYLTDKLSQLTF